MKSKKSIYIAVLTFVFIICIFFHFGFSKKVNIVKPEIESKSLSDIPESETKNNIQVVLNVLGKTYTTKLKEGATVYDAMSDIKNTKENNFSFISKEYSGLGIFVDEINGIKGVSGKYWVYSVNGKEASVSVSKYILKGGDNILWEQKEF